MIAFLSRLHYPTPFPLLPEFGARDPGFPGPWGRKGRFQLVPRCLSVLSPNIRLLLLLRISTTAGTNPDTILIVRLLRIIIIINITTN
ncbi:hypothetical protein N9L68_05820 [bacterium]|nr:hypothetical protein [bacterium]